MSLSKIVDSYKGRLFASIVFLAGDCLDAVTQIFEMHKHRPTGWPSLTGPDPTVQIWVRDLANHALLGLYVLHRKINRVGLSDCQTSRSFQRHRDTPNSHRQRSMGRVLRNRKGAT
jgi:hypothetical protein